MKKELIGAFAWAGLMIALALGATFAKRHGYIAGDTATRVVIGMNGLWMAWYGNKIPKTFAPSACARRAQRVSAWSMVLSGLVYTGLWAFAPIPMAIWVGSGAVFASVAVTLGYCLWLRAKSKTA
jgi:ammonia channel protein AmtB